MSLLGLLDLLGDEIDDIDEGWCTLVLLMDLMDDMVERPSR